MTSASSLPCSSVALVDREPEAQVVAVDYIGFAGNLANLDPVIDRVTFEKADIADLEVMEALYRRHRPDYVVNFAAESHNDRAILGPSAFMRSNALGAQVMAECSRLVPVRSHVHVSTIEVYGELPATEKWFTEASPLNAKTPYSAAKAAGDQMVRAYMATYPEMNIRMTHCANNFGPYQLPEKLIPPGVTNVLRGRKIPVYGDGLQSRDWLHVLDHCDAVHTVLHAELGPTPAAAATNPGLLPIFDISARHEVTNIDIARLVAAELTALIESGSVPLSMIGRCRLCWGAAGYGRNAGCVRGWWRRGVVAVDVPASPGCARGGCERGWVHDPVRCCDQGDPAAVSGMRGGFFAGSQPLLA